MKDIKVARRVKKTLQKVKDDVHSSYWKNKALVVWGKIVRKRDKKCVYCHEVFRLNAHHILPKERYQKYMFAVDNGITLCCNHHKYGSPSAHICTIWFFKFLKENYKKVFDLAYERCYNYGRPEKKYNFKLEYERLLEIFEKM